MPYFIVDKAIKSLTWEEIECSCQWVSADDGCRAIGSTSLSLVPFEERQSAVDELQPGQHVIFLATTTERLGWQQREANRFLYSEYLQTPRANCNYYPNHYAHLSIKQPGMVAYTKNDEHGIADRQTIIRPGRYLTEFYSKYFDADQIQRYIGQCSAENQMLKIAKSAKEIRRVYEGGPNSCMGGPDGAGKQFKSWLIHPVEVYGDSDLAVAYYGSIDKASARAICIPAKKIYGRVYGSAAVLQALLHAADYNQGTTNDFEGCRIRAIEGRNGRLIVPYVDWIEWGEQKNDWIILGSGDIDLQTIEGAIDNEDENDQICDNCETEYDGNLTDSGYCPTCDANRFYCNGCVRDCWGEATRLTSGAWLCESCAEVEKKECTIEGCNHTWIEGTLILEQQQGRARRHVADMCLDCSLIYQACSGCDDAFPIEDSKCPYCDQTVRCDKTIELPLHPLATGLLCWDCNLPDGHLGDCQSDLETAVSA